MTASTVYLSRALGLVLLLAAVLMLADKAAALGFAAVIGADPVLNVALGVGRVVAGAAILLIHNVWNKGFWLLLVTLCGWVILIRGVAVLFLPREVFNAVVAAAHVPEFYYLYAAAPLILGGYLCLRGFSASTAR